MSFTEINTSNAMAPMSPTSSQVAAIPIRWTNGRPEVLLVTTRGTGRWTAPKGWPLSESLASECAAREAFEEAGVRGQVEPFSLGTFQYWKHTKKGRAYLEVTAFALHVEQIAHDWPERGERKRAWFSPDVACRLANNDELSALIRAAVQVRAPAITWRERAPAAGRAN
jgi:8-oxo-dGTP pyrophosphatase MutT (NUDIX family)